MADERWLIVGLGNPGAEYAGNRHNAGFLVADLLADRASARLRGSKFRASVGDGRLAGLPVTIAKPLTYMNESGGPVAALRDYYRLQAAGSWCSTMSWTCHSGRYGSNWAAEIMGTTDFVR